MIKETTVSDWEVAYNKKQNKYHKLKHKYKKNERKIKNLKAQRKNSYGSKERAIKKKIAKCKKIHNKWKPQVKALKKKLYAMEKALRKQQWEYEFLKMQAETDKRIVYLETRDAITNMLLKEAVPELMKKYGRSFKPPRNNSNVINAPGYTITDIEV